MDNWEYYDDGWRRCEKCGDGFTIWYEDIAEQQENGNINCYSDYKPECEECLADECLCGSCFEEESINLPKKSCFLKEKPHLLEEISPGLKEEIGKLIRKIYAKLWNEI